MLLGGIQPVPYDRDGSRAVVRGRGLEKANQALVCADLGENLVFDTAGCADFDFARRFTARYGAQRVVFGSGRYSSTTARKRHHILSDLLAADLPDEDKHAIVAGNISRIFGL